MLSEPYEAESPMKYRVLKYDIDLCQLAEFQQESKNFDNVIYLVDQLKWSKTYD